MTPEKQRIAIAEACGGRFETQTVCPCCKGVTPYEAGDDYGITIWNECQNCNNTGEVEPYSPQIPDYLNDLNAAWGAVRTLDEWHKQKFAYVLLSLVGGHLEKASFVDGEFLGCEEWTSGEVMEVALAAPSQIAEAFLRTLNLWIED